MMDLGGAVAAMWLRRQMYRIAMHWWQMLEDDEWGYQTQLDFMPIQGGELWPSGTVVIYE